MKYEEVEVNSERWFDLEPLLNEEFRDIKGFENFYQISNYGRVKSLKKYHGISKEYYNRERILKNLPHKGGYLKVGFNKNKKKKSFLIHQLVATSFILNENNYKEINHIDCNKYNNRIDNLEWCSRSYNILHAYKNEKFSSQKEHLKKLWVKQSKPVLQFTLDNIFVKKWDSVAQIEKTLGFSHSVIGNCCLNKPHCLTAYGYKWKYKEEE